MKLANNLIEWLWFEGETPMRQSPTLRMPWQGVILALEKLVWSEISIYLLKVTKIANLRYGESKKWIEVKSPDTKLSIDGLEPFQVKHCENSIKLNDPKFSSTNLPLLQKSRLVWEKRRWSSKHRPTSRNRKVRRQSLRLEVLAGTYQSYDRNMQTTQRPWKLFRHN